MQQERGDFVWKKLKNSLKNVDWYDINSKIAGFIVFFSWFLFFSYMIYVSICGVLEKETLFFSIPIALIFLVLSIIFLFKGI